MKNRLYLSGFNGVALPRTVYVDDIEIGTVSPVFDYTGALLPWWKAIDLRGNNHGDTYLSAFDAAHQLALAVHAYPTKP